MTREDMAIGRENLRLALINRILELCVMPRRTWPRQREIDALTRTLEDLNKYDPARAMG